MRTVLAILVAMMVLLTSSVVLAEEPLKISSIDTLYQQAPAEDGAFWKWVEETFNVDYTVEWVPSAGYDDKISLMLNTGALPDTIYVSSVSGPAVQKAARDGMFYDLTDLITPEKYPNLANLNPTAYQISKIDNRNYFLPRTRGQYNMAIFVRSDIVKEAGLESIKTIADFEAYLYYIRDNYPDMVPLALTLTNLRSYFLGAFGHGQITPVYTEDGEGIVEEQLTESYAKLIEWAQKLYKDGVYASEFALYTNSRTEELFEGGLTSMECKNIWHRYRLADTIKKVDPEANVEMVLSFTGTDGNVAMFYDSGLLGGRAFNADLPLEKVEKMLEFYDKTADPAMYNNFRYGLEGIHWTMVDGFPAVTEQGTAEVTNSIYGPFVLATNLYDKVDSPLASAEYNLETRELVKELDKAAADFGACPVRLFTVLQSDAWADFWSVYSADFNNYVAETVMGNHTIDEFRAYQQKFIEMDDVQQAFREFKANYDELDLGNWAPPVME